MKKLIRKSVWYFLIVLTVCAGIAVKNVSYAASEQTTDDKMYKVDVYSEGYVGIYQYLGTESKVTIPSKVIVGGRAYLVTRLSCLENFAPNANVKDVYLPASINKYDSGIFNGVGTLENIYVYQTDPYYNFLFDKDGILYANVGSNDIVLVKYPEGKAGTQYVLPNEVNRLNFCFMGKLNLKKIILHENVESVGEYAISPTSDIQLYINCSTLYQFSNKSICHLHSGSTIYVKTDALKTQLETTKKDILYDCDGVNIVSLQSNSSASVPCTSLTFEDGSTVKNITLSPGQTYKINYNKAPADTTDTITWKTSGESAAFYSMNNLGHPIGTVLAQRGGQTVVTGTTESGKTITLNVNVFEPIQSVTAGGGSEGTFVCSKENDYDDDGMWTFRDFYLEVSPWTASNYMKYEKREWVSSDVSIATVPDKTDGMLLLTGKVGTVGITATLNDDGRVFTVPFTLHVKKSMDLLTVDEIPPQTGNPSARPKPVVRDGAKVLTEGVDYTLDYKADNPYWAAVTINGIGNYEGVTGTSFYIGSDTGGSSPGTVPAGLVYDPASGMFVDPATGTYYTIDPNTGAFVPYNPNSGTTQPQPPTGGGTASQGITGVRERYDKYYGDKAFTLKASCPGSTGKITYSSSNKKIVTVGSTNGKVTVKGTGAAVITIRCGSLSRKVTITVAPKKMAKPKVKAGKKQFKVSWKKDSRADGYEIQYSTDKKLKKGCYAQAVKKNKTTSQTIKKKLKSKKTYYVRIRAYKSGKVNGKNTKIYSKWSSTVKVKVK